jgi:hypothetical protein
MDVPWLTLAVWTWHAMAPRVQKGYVPKMVGKDEEVDLTERKAKFWADYILPVTYKFSLLEAARIVNWRLTGPYTLKQQEYFTLPPLYQAMLPSGSTHQPNLSCFILHCMMPGQFQPDSQGVTQVYGSGPQPLLTFDRSLRLVSLSNDRPFDGDWGSVNFRDSLHRDMEHYMTGYHNTHHVAQYKFLQDIVECGDAAVQAFWKPFTHQAKEIECINCKTGFYKDSPAIRPDGLRRLPAEWAQRIERARALSHLPYHHHLTQLYDTCREWCARTRVPLVTLPAFDIPPGYCVHSLFLVNFFLFVNGDVHHLDFSTAELPFPRFLVNPDTLPNLLTSRLVYLPQNTSLRFSQYLEMTRNPHHDLWLEHDRCLRAASTTFLGFAYRGALTTMMPTYFTV